MENKTSNFQNEPRSRETYGEILTNGTIIELVVPSSGDRVALLRWDGQNCEIGARFKDGSTIYRAPQLHSSLLQATRFPGGLVPYGTPTGLFWKVVALFCRYIGFSREQAAFMARVVFCSWFPDCCARPLTLCITGMDMDQVMKLFRLLHALCRRPLVVAELSLSLPLSLCY